MSNQVHRPLTRTIVKLHDDGMPIVEIAWRLRRSPGHISRVLQWTTLPRPAQTANPASAPASSPSVLRPLERRVIHARDAGIDRTETAARFRRSPQHIAKIEGYADAKLARLS